MTNEAFPRAMDPYFIESQDMLQYEESLVTANKATIKPQKWCQTKERPITFGEGILGTLRYFTTLVVILTPCPLAIKHGPPQQ